MSNSVGQGTEELAAIVKQDLDKQGDRLAPGSAELLSRIWSPLGTASPEARAKEIERLLSSDRVKAVHVRADYKPPDAPRLAERARASTAAQPRADSPQAERLSAAIRSEFPIGDAGLTRLLAERPDLARMDDRTLTRSLAQAFRSPVFASRYQGPVISEGDYRLAEQTRPRTVVAKQDQHRGDDGRFSAPPVAPTRKSRISF